MGILVMIGQSPLYDGLGYLFDLKWKNMDICQV